jgi:hypothetical protein
LRRDLLQRRAPLAALSRVIEQIAAYCASALTSGTMFYRWWLLDTDARKRVWRLYGWYSALMLFGSCFGAVTWAAWMQFLDNFFTGENHLTNRNFAEWMNSFERAYAWRSAFTVTYVSPLKHVLYFGMNLTRQQVRDRVPVPEHSEADGP